MTERIYNIENYETDHTTFGGLIYPSDFNTDYRGKNSTKGSPIASRIASDRQFDKQCRKYREENERNKQFVK